MRISRTQLSLACCVGLAFGASGAQAQGDLFTGGAGDLGRDLSRAGNQAPAGPGNQAQDPFAPGGQAPVSPDAQDPFAVQTVPLQLTRLDTDGEGCDDDSIASVRLIEDGPLRAVRVDFNRDGIDRFRVPAAEGVDLIIDAVGAILPLTRKECRVQIDLRMTPNARIEVRRVARQGSYVNPGGRGRFSLTTEFQLRSDGVAASTPERMTEVPSGDFGDPVTVFSNLDPLNDPIEVRAGSSGEIELRMNLELERRGVAVGSLRLDALLLEILTARD